MSQNPLVRPVTRRWLLLAGAAAGAALAFPPILRPAAAFGATHTLSPGPARIRMVGDAHPETTVWAYDGQVPGPQIRVRQGDRLRIEVTNRLAEETTVHWHGLRVPNAMDGVPHLTQRPIGPFETFTYEFDAVDAGTFWYHPHQRSHEQVGRGLHGALIVEEREPVPVNRDLCWVLGDWRLRGDASISNDFGAMMDMSHGGRVGNTVTVNGRVLDEVPVRAGERVRLRLVNAANARIFGLRFQGHRPVVIAIDGHPVEPHEPEDGRILLAPAMRMDLVLDMAGAPGERAAVIDDFHPRLAYRLLDLGYGPDRLRDRPPETPIRLPANPVAEPDLSAAVRHQVTLGGGMMGSMAGALVDGRMTDMRTLLRQGMAWAINGVAAGGADRHGGEASGHVMDPIFTIQRGRTCVIAMANDTAWHHPMHLHGHTFRVLSRNGRPTRFKEWQDTVLLAPRERVEIAFVADNPGDWMFHCHILEHQAAGMMSTIRVA
ncbi:multicopper oxidase family protein [Skermanella mucosa]|uniref:multicopper oxidase family protein n=1 Tax=Skermanella mucosa TaxID=1789672 RepID=UPI00192B2DB7|nr:multicopper oxidase family protein [Skermanella mucosa]UEM19088.1 multicopper oxidase family protein [Skermanella mucosa]